MKLVKNQWLAAVLQAGCCLVLAGAVSTAFAADAPDPKAPQLQPADKKTAWGQEVQTWDRPEAFGPVPESLRTRGDTSCLMQGVDLEAAGYHPGALREGKPIAGGGFYCQPKSTGERPQDTPPRLLSLKNTIGWDRPSAFGKVPDALAAQGARVCASAGPALRAIGYHPQARDAKNTLIAGGGFFCAPIAR
jgi:hypothetical protein